MKTSFKKSLEESVSKIVKAEKSSKLLGEPERVIFPRRSIPETFFDGFQFDSQFLFIKALIFFPSVNNAFADTPYEYVQCYCGQELVFYVCSLLDLSYMNIYSVKASKKRQVCP